MSIFVRVLLVLVLFSLTVSIDGSRIWAADQTFGPFAVRDSAPDVIELNGAIDAGSALNFRRAVTAAPNAKLVTLNSPGGSVQMGLLIADDIHQRKLSTYVPKDSQCMSACSYIFLAGIERKADGDLGVHQIASDSADIVSAQITIADIIDVLNRFDTPTEVMTVMFKTPPNQIHVFTAEEIEKYKLDRPVTSQTQKPLEITVPVGGVSAPFTPRDISAPTSPPTLDPAKLAAAASPSKDTPAPNGSSAIEDYAHRPNRFAVYAGLDLFGSDITSVRVNDAGSCAQSCLAMNGTCKAFTFNTNAKLVHGPNCFLKSSAGRADGNSEAFSGRLLSASESDPGPVTLSVIDPISAIFDNFDLPGGDLSGLPNASAHTPVDCRLACIDDNRCVAFTYIRAKKQCWLKAAISTPQPAKGMVTGIKKIQSFAAPKIIGLN